MGQKKFEEANEKKARVVEINNILVSLEKEEADKKKDSELLKLLFVGITRAKYGLTISFADMEENKANQGGKFLPKWNKMIV